MPRGEERWLGEAPRGGGMGFTDSDDAERLQVQGRLRAAAPE